MLLVSNLANTKWCKKPEKWLKPWHLGSHMRVLEESYPINTKMTGFKILCFLVHWTKVASAMEGLTPLMLRLLLSKAQGRKVFWKPFKPCHVGIHWIALAEYFQMSTHMPGFQSFFQVFAPFCIGQLASSSIRVKVRM